MKNRFARLNPQVFLTIAAIAVGTVLAVHSPASANSAATSGTVLNFTNTSQALLDVESFLKGPVAFGISVLAIIVGAYMVFNGQDMGQGIKVLGTVALTLGFLAASSNLFINGAASSAVPEHATAYGYTVAHAPVHSMKALR